MKVLVYILLLASLCVNAQNAVRFSEDVKQLQAKYALNSADTLNNIVFTGSSSIRAWTNLEDQFPEHNIINTGFGGSMASDLLHFTDELILNYQPKMVFIYEGDNDISEGKKAKVILQDLTAIIEKIKNKNQATQIVLIAAKPSVARWELKRDYKKLNRKIKRLAKKTSALSFADIWKPMLDGRKVKTDIFIADNLHMNNKGYQIWYNVIKNYIK